MKQLNAEIYGLSNIQKKVFMRLFQKKRYFKKVFADINNINEDLHQKLISIEIDYVFHFAAQSLVEVAYSNQETLMTNIIGTYNILVI